MNNCPLCKTSFPVGELPSQLESYIAHYDCGEKKKQSDFLDSKLGQCRDCRKAHYQRTRESKLAYNREYNKNNPKPGRDASYRYWRRNRERLNKEKRTKTAEKHGVEG